MATAHLKQAHWLQSANIAGNALKYFAWLLKAVIFFVLFAFALNNQEPVNLHLFFGTTWRTPMVLVVLATFVAGLFAGIAIMLPLWWTARRQARAPAPSVTPAETVPTPPSNTPSTMGHTDGV